MGYSSPVPKIPDRDLQRFATLRRLKHTLNSLLDGKLKLTHGFGTAEGRCRRQVGAQLAVAAGLSCLLPHCRLSNCMCFLACRFAFLLSPFGVCCLIFAFSSRARVKEHGAHSWHARSVTTGLCDLLCFSLHGSQTIAGAHGRRVASRHVPPRPIQRSGHG